MEFNYLKKKLCIYRNSANTVTPKKTVFDPLKNYQICTKDLSIVINGRKFSRRCDVASSESNKLYDDLYELFPDLSNDPGKSFICLECHNQHNSFTLKEQIEGSGKCLGENIIYCKL